MPDDREESKTEDAPDEPQDENSSTPSADNGDVAVDADDGPAGPVDERSTDSDDGSQTAETDGTERAGAADDQLADSDAERQGDTERTTADNEEQSADIEQTTADNEELSADAEQITDDAEEDQPSESARTPGEGGLTYQGSPDVDHERRENPAKPSVDGDADEQSEESSVAPADAAAEPSTAEAASESATENSPAESSEEAQVATAEASTSGTPVPSASTGTATDTGDETEEIGGISTPPDDEEMPLADHIEEMVSRLAIVILIGAAGTAIGLLWATDAIEIIWGEAIPRADEWRPHIYGPLELWMTRIKVASLLGVMIALPMFVYQTYLFMRPGLYSHERKYYLAAVPTSVILAGIGMLFSYLLVLPVLFSYFTYYSEGSASIKYALGPTFNLIITLTAFLAIVFQIPLFIMLAVMMGVTSRRWLADKRLYFWAAFAGLAFTFTIDPTAMAAGLVAITMIVLFEGTLLLLKWTGVD